ncbi:MAG: AAA family ATPase [Candidatus Coproplasma sp.]
MNERSKFLDLVFERYGIEDDSRSSLNRLFIELLKLLLPDAQMPDYPVEIAEQVLEEKNRIRLFFVSSKIDIPTVLSAMEAAVNSSAEQASSGFATGDFLDSFMFRKVMRDVEQFDTFNNGTTVNALFLCERILASPTAAISAALAGKPLAERKSVVADAAEDDGQEAQDADGESEEESQGTEEESQGAAEDGGEESQGTEEEGQGDGDEPIDEDEFLRRFFGDGYHSVTGKKTTESTPAVKPTMSELMDKVEKLRTVLSENVFGQDHAIAAFVSGFFQAELTAAVFEDRDKPRATFLFAGPPGVGKTFLSELVAKALELPFKRFDMSEYNHKEANLEFCGSDKVYKNGAKGNVTGFVEENPHCVLLFDEIEKAHISVIYLFLQMLDAGRLRDNFTDEEVSFKDAIIILTTNAGKRLYEDESINLVNTPKKTILKALGAEVNPETREPLFPTAICSRFASGNVVMFNRMQGDFLLKISESEMKKQCDAIARNMDIKVTFDSSIPYAVLFGEGGKADARTIKAKSIKFIYDETYELLRLMKSKDNPYDVSALKSVHFKLFPTQDEEIVSLFENQGETSVLVFADKSKHASCAKKLKGVTVLTADNIGEAKELLDINDVGLVLCDITYNTRGIKDILNREDLHSTGRDFFDYITAKTNIPVYIMQSRRNKFSDEELQSLTSVGASGVFDETWSAAQTRDFVKHITHCAHLKKSMASLARANKVLSFGTVQTIKKNSEEAVISLYDLKLATAVDAEDNEGMINDVSRPSVRFDDVIGAKDAKGELRYFIDYLKDPVKYVKRGIKAPKGILLYGPPGTGKTLLAKAMAGESNVTFIRAEGNQFLKKYVGQGVESVHKLFATARKYAPSILFIDEIDAIAKDRQKGGESSNGSDVLTAFLTEMDGFSTDKDRPVFVLAATNFSVDKDNPRSLDPALLRRFDRRIYIDLPDREERTQFIDLRISKIRNHSITRDAVENLALRSTGASLAELDSVFELAIRNVIKADDGILSDKVLEEAFETFSNGEVKKWDETELLRTARHEAGHAVVCWASGEKPSYLTIVARADHGGYMQHGDNEKKGTYTRSDLLARVRTALGGRAAEIVYYGDEDGLSSGASGDLQTATAIMQAMICSYGMDEKMGLCTLNLSEVSRSPYYAQILERVNQRLNEEFANAKAIIERNKEGVDRLVSELLSKNALKGNEIEAVLKDCFVK